MTRDLLILAAAVLLLRAPFLNQAVQGDESTFLACAAHAQIDPLHPNHVHYIFTPVELDVDLQGGSHLPMDAWVLAGLIAIFGGVKEVPFHAAYIAFSLLVVFAMYSIARRFSAQPLWAALLFLAVPAFVVNGGSFEADVPHLAFFLCGIACFITAAKRRSLPWLVASAIALACAALTVIQAQMAFPILLAYTWMYARTWKPAWIAALAPSIALAAWQIFERMSSGEFPILRTAHYLNQQRWDQISLKLDNAAGLFMHLWFIVFPVLFVAGVWAAWRRHDRDTTFLAAWIAIYFVGACVPFIDGSARYLLPIAAPVAIWASYARRSWVIAGFAVQMALSLGLAIANYQHWDAYRDFSHEIVQQAAGRRIWVNSEWGLRHYMEDAGARVPNPAQFIPPGDVVVWSELVHPVSLTHPGELVASLLTKDVRPSMPFRIIGLESHSGFSSIHAGGFFPFGIGDGLVDRIHADIYKEAKPTLQDLPMNAPEAESQIVSGLFGLEEGKQRWTSGTATVMLVSPPDAEPLHADVYLPDNAPARKVSLLFDGQVAYTTILPGPGIHRIVSPPQKPRGATSVVALQVDRTFSAPGDSRVLGLVLRDIGWGK